MLSKRLHHLVFLSSVLLVGFIWLSSQPSNSWASLLSEQGMLEFLGGRDHTVQLQQKRSDWAGVWLTLLDAQSNGTLSAPWSLFKNNEAKYVWLSRVEGDEQLVAHKDGSVKAMKGISEIDVAQGEQIESIAVVSNEKESAQVMRVKQLGMSTITSQQLSRLPYAVRHPRVAHLIDQSRPRAYAAYVYDQLNTVYIADLDRLQREQALASASLQQPLTSLSLAVLNRNQVQQAQLLIVMTITTQADGHKLVVTACSPVGPDIVDRIVDCGLPTVIQTYPLTSAVSLLESTDSNRGVRLLIREQTSESVTTLASMVLRQNEANGQLEMVESFAYNAVGSVLAASLLDLNQNAYLLGMIEAGELMLLHITDTEHGSQVSHYPLPLPIRELSRAGGIRDVRLQLNDNDMLLNLATTDAHVWSFQSSKP